MFYQTQTARRPPKTPWQRRNGPVCCCSTFFAASTLQCVMQQNGPFRRCPGGNGSVQRLVSWSLTSLFSTNMAISETRVYSAFFVPGDIDLWPWHSNLSERGTKHVLHVNLAQIRSAVPEIFDSQTKKQTKKQTKSHSAKNRTSRSSFTVTTF